MARCGTIYKQMAKPENPNKIINPESPIRIQNHLLLGGIPLSGVRSQDVESALSASRRIDGYGGGRSGAWENKVRDRWRKGIEHWKSKRALEK